MTHTNGFAKGQEMERDVLKKRREVEKCIHLQDAFAS